jgi:hypothetical protein
MEKIILSIIFFVSLSIVGCYTTNSAQNSSITKHNEREEEMLRARQESQKIVEGRENEKRVEQEEIQRRKDIAIENAKLITQNDNIRIVELKHHFDFSNPYAFNTKVLYYCDSDYLYIWQWLERSFVGSFLPQEATYQLPYNTEFFIRRVPDVTRIRQRITNIYMVYIGTQTFTRINGASQVFAVFDILDFDE